MHFQKYSSTGNDFIVINASQGGLDDLSSQMIRHLCHRNYGIGADGILLIRESLATEEYDFSMQYFNADGNEVGMCGNGARAAIHFAYHFLNLANKKELTFKTLNGVYLGAIENGLVRLKMTELYDEGVISIEELFKADFSFYINTGVPHCVYFVEDVEKIDIGISAPPIRHDKRFIDGVNVNFVQSLTPNKLKMRTFERGVEGETLSCGTGAVAVAVAAFRYLGFSGEIEIETPGGKLTVSLEESLEVIFLSGNAINVFSGELDLSRIAL